MGAPITPKQFGFVSNQVQNILDTLELNVGIVAKVSKQVARVAATITIICAPLALPLIAAAAGSYLATELKGFNTFLNKLWTCTDNSDKIVVAWALIMATLVMPKITVAILSMKAGIYIREQFKS